MNGSYGLCISIKRNCEQLEHLAHLVPLLPTYFHFHFNSVQLSLIKFSCNQFSSAPIIISISYNLIQFSSVQLQSVQFSSVQCNSIQFNYFISNSRGLSSKYIIQKLCLHNLVTTSVRSDCCHIIEILFVCENYIIQSLYFISHPFVIFFGFFFLE